MAKKNLIQKGSEDSGTVEAKTTIRRGRLVKTPAGRTMLELLDQKGDPEDDLVLLDLFPPDAKRSHLDDASGPIGSWEITVRFNEEA